MLILISPAKTLDFKNPVKTDFHTTPEFLNKSQQLVRKLKKLKPDQLSELMKISPKLGQLNYERFQLWNIEHSGEETKQAVFAFKGDVYIGLDIHMFTDSDLKNAQDILRILSGLYGLLRPMDLIRPYRLEMGTPLPVNSKKNLYEFWGDSITKRINKQLKEIDSELLINLASDEYFKSINTSKIKARIVTPVFKDFKNGSYKFLSFYGKKARGMMTRFIIKNNIEKVDELKLFEEDGYFYNESMSTNDKFVFTRG